MSKQGRTITEPELDEIMLKHDLNKEGYLTINDFTKIFIDL
jgi:Ca2+-binding EF-hand superfamily protein